jgi:hypothetical protein
LAEADPRPLLLAVAAEYLVAAGDEDLRDPERYSAKPH